jgi:hypothetical protein
MLDYMCSDAVDQALGYKKRSFNRLSPIERFSAWVLAALICVSLVIDILQAVDS